MIRVYVTGIGVLGPGLESWPGGSAVLRGERPYSAALPPEPAAGILPPNERRRTSELARWALHVGEEAIRQAQADPRETATVFACSGGETGILDRLCRALASPERLISPTLFHHSVHNAAAGYWGIATGSRQSSASLACYDSSFGAGLLEAAAQVATEQIPVLLVAYDLPPPPPLYAARPLSTGFAVALVLAGSPSLTSSARLELSLDHHPGEEASRLDHSELELLRIGNPAARALPLLAAIAGARRTLVRLDYLEDQHLLVQVAPCPS